MKGAKRIIKKELARVFKDKKLIFTMFILPAILMFAIYGLIGTLMKSMSNDIQEHKDIVTVVNAPESFKNVVKATGYDISAGVSYTDTSGFEGNRAAYEDDVKNGNCDLIIVFDEDFDKTFKAYENKGDRIPGLTVYYNSTENYSSKAYNVFTNMVANTYRTALQTERIGNIEQLEVFNVTEQKLEKEAKQGTQFLSMMLPYMMVLMLFSSAMSITVDAIAGEKERGTLASMLLAPISRTEIVVGKLVSLSIISTLSAIVYCVSMVFAMPMMQEGMGGSGSVSFSFIGPDTGLMLLATIVLMNLLFVSLLSALSICAKDQKTASTLVSPMYILVVMAGVMTMFSNGSVATWKYAIPVYGNALVIQQICSGEAVMSSFLASTCGLVVAIVLFVGLTSKAFNSEKIMFNA